MESQGGGGFLILITVSMAWGGGGEVAVWEGGGARVRGAVTSMSEHGLGSDGAVKGWTAQGTCSAWLQPESLI